MMVAFGALDEVRPTELFNSDTEVEPARPGNETAPLLSIHRQPESTSTVQALEATVLAQAQHTRDRAIHLVEHLRTSTTLAALAQAHATVGESVQAVSAARQALTMSLEPVRSPEGPDEVLDPSSARLAAEVLLRFQETNYAYEILGRATLPASLRLTFATVAVALGHHDQALSTIDVLTGALVESFRGFLLTVKEDYPKAIPHLRRALRLAPQDADAAFNLSICLWQVGGHRKATLMALRASRTAPGRKDLSLHYLELLLAQNLTDEADREISSLKHRRVIPDAQFLVIQARTFLARNQIPRAVALLHAALTEAAKEGDVRRRGEISANLVALKHYQGKVTGEKALTDLSELMREFHGNEAVVVNFARFATRKTHASTLRRAMEQMDPQLPAHRAFLRYQLAQLEGDNDTAGAAAQEWFELDKRDPAAISAALVAVGIGLEQWDTASIIADYALGLNLNNPALVNDAAYVLAMGGRAREAIALIQALPTKSFVLRATLGLAYLAAGEVDRGMQLYRDAAVEAEQHRHEWLSLMTTYQALVVRQLGLDVTIDQAKLSALALAPIDLPSDWPDQPGFLRLHTLCIRKGYTWPLQL